MVLVELFDISGKKNSRAISAKVTSAVRDAVINAGLNCFMVSSCLKGTLGAGGA